MVNQLFINNDFCSAESGRTVSLVNPATEKPFVEVASAGRRDVERAVAGANQAFQNIWRDFAPGKRAAILFSLAQKIRESLEELAQLETLQVGKPIADS